MADMVPQILPPDHKGPPAFITKPTVVKAVKAGSALVLFGFAEWAFQNFLSLRGVVDLLASRIQLLILAACLTGIVCIVTSGTSRARRYRILGLLVSFGVVGFLDWWAPKPNDSSGRATANRKSTCAVQDERRPLRATPLPDKATDQQLADEALLIGNSIMDMVVSEQNAQRSNTVNAHALACANLQNYETNIRVPATSIQSAMLRRLPIQDRSRSSTVDMKGKYEYPAGQLDLLDIVEDLQRIVEFMNKEKGIEARTPTTQWIVPIAKSRIRPLPYTEADTKLVQDFSRGNYTAQIRCAYYLTCGQALITVKNHLLDPKVKKARIQFSGHIGPIVVNRPEGTEVGVDYIDFMVTSGHLSASAELWMFPAQTAITGIKTF
jgi:hypothetical protein